MLTADFDFHLPSELIAERPLPKGKSRLFCPQLKTVDRTFSELPHLLEPGDLLVVNNTRVIPARLFGHRADTGGKIEILLTERTDRKRWHCLLRPGRRARAGLVIDFGDGLEATIGGRVDGGLFRLDFSTEVEEFLDRIGHIPLPPYIKRPDTARDRDDYQTVYAREPGSIAAPTAGLHFTNEILEALRARGIRVAEVTLRVGIGTFKPITADLVHEHQMDRESYEIPISTAAALSETRAAGGRIVAVGTTVVRTLESAAIASEDLPQAGAASTELFITPGFRFRVVDRLVTNFHLPRSSLLILVSAFAGREKTLAAYRRAVESGYRFYSYGDAMLLDRES